MNRAGVHRHDLDTPALWVDLDILERNVASLAAYFRDRGVGWRPHIKGIKVPAIARMAVEAGALGVTCAKLGEASTMAAAGIGDILVANQIVGRKIARLVDLRHRWPEVDIKVAVDSEGNVAELGRAARAAGVSLGVVVEVDVGMDRAGVSPGGPAVDLSRLVHRTDGLRYEGLMAWEGHSRKEMDPQRRRNLIKEAVALLVDSAQRCRDAGLPVGVVSAGGTGTYYVTAVQPGITEIQAGGAVFCDALACDWDAIPDPAAAPPPTAPCLFVQTTVTSRPSPTRIICDAGFKTLPVWSRAPEPVGLPGVRATHASAEHLKVELAAPDMAIQVGDLLDFVVGYGDSTLFLHDHLYGVRGGVLEVAWPIEAGGQSR